MKLGSLILVAKQMGDIQFAVSRMIADPETEGNVELLRRSRAGLEGLPFIKLREKADFDVSYFLDCISYKSKLCYEVSRDHTVLSMVE